MACRWNRVPSVDVAPWCRTYGMEFRQLDVVAIAAAVCMYGYLLREHFMERREPFWALRSARVLVIPVVIVAAALLTQNWIPAPVIVGIAIWNLRKPTVPKPPVSAQR